MFGWLLEPIGVDSWIGGNSLWQYRQITASALIISAQKGQLRSASSFASSSGVCFILATANQSAQEDKTTKHHQCLLLAN